MAAEHSHGHGMAGRKLAVAFALTAVLLLVELAGAIFSHSLALFSDAGHVLTDVLALGLAWFATHQAERPANARKTYGYHRAGILTALLNAVALILIVVAIAYEAFERLARPVRVVPWAMFAVAAVGIAVNLYIALALRAESHENLNLRAATLHVLGDIGASAGVIIGGLVILFTGWYPADPLISLGIAALIAVGAWRLLREAVDVLMEATPADVDVARLIADLTRQPGVAGVHDLHVWSIAGGMRALSAHVQVGDQLVSESDALLERLNRLLAERHRIDHSTIQFECAGCEPDELYCTLPGGEPHDHTSHAGHQADGDGAAEPSGSGPVDARR